MYEIVAVRAVPSSDETHWHVEFVGYESAHMPGEPIFISIPSAAMKMAFGEKFFVRVRDEKAIVESSKCPVCGFEPALKTSADSGDVSHLLALPAK